MLSRQTLDTIISIAKMEIDPVTNKDYEELVRNGIYLHLGNRDDCIERLT